ncbi:hypothetical protein [Nocardia altamirensis]|uniref:hypothetical protein n=1 Tax=Nocardia altamirensis TaxID=472158 RepID=UPI0008401E7F|nr:hypothetical protein [Nocardia altamirensis]
MRPSIVITGSGSPHRQYTPPLKDLPGLPDACEAIGRELVLSGCDLVVFSSSEDYIEKDVVRGYLSALDMNHPGTVIVRTPYDREVNFDVPEHLKHVVQIKPDAAAEWEVSFYRELFKTDGLIVIGGGRATRIAGILAIAQHTPIIALATFGASALSVWHHLDRHRNDVTDDDLHLMAGPWAEHSAAALVSSLLDQLARRHEILRRRKRNEAKLQWTRTVHGLAAILALALAAFTVWLSFGTATAATAVAYLLLGPLLTAIGGALLRDTRSDKPNLVWSAARGLGAGMLAATLYVASQQLTNPDPFTADTARRLAWFLVPIGFAAGYTVDLIFDKLRRVDALAEQPFTR